MLPVQSARRPTRWVLTALLLFSLVAHARAELRLEASGGHVYLDPGTGAATERPIRFLVQEWKAKGTETAEPTGPAAEVNTVGSIVEQEAADLAFLAPLNDPWTAPNSATVNATEAGFEQTLVLPGDFELQAIFEGFEDRVVVRGTLTNRAPDPERRERPLTLSLAVPLEGEDLVWWSDNHRHESADSNRELINPVSTLAGARGVMSRYPFGAMSGPGFALALGLPFDQPRIQRIRWDGAARLLIAEVDVAVSPEPRKFPDQIPFEFWLFEFPAEFGFRGAARRFYDLNPGSYALRLERQGQWMPFSPIDSVRRPEDFGFAFHEYHPTISVSYNQPNRVESLVYCEPPVQYIHMDAATPRTLDALKQLIEAKNDRQGAQIRSSATHELSGEIEVAWVETPWAVGARIPTNGDPEIPRSARNPYNSFDANWLAYADLYRRAAEDRPAHWSGSGSIVDGVLGASGRALALAPGQEVRQSIRMESAAAGAEFAAEVKSREDARLKIRLETPTFKREYTLDVPGGVSFRRMVLPLEEFVSQAGADLEEFVDLSIAADESDIWVDEIGASGLKIKNASFDEGEFDREAVTGLYLDSFEGWDSKDMNFRRQHFAWVDSPLTFDTRTGTTGQVIMLHNFELAAEARERLHDRGHLLMANTALYQWSWSAHYLDILGIETSWGEGARISPPRVEEMDYVRTMLYHKPYCYLQNVRFENFRGEKVKHYFARCFHYGFWPGFFSHNAAEAPYWQDPELYNADRPVFLHFTQPQRSLTAAGWEPLTLAEVSDAALLVERWGGGAWGRVSDDSGVFALTVYNPTNALRSARLIPDARLLRGDKHIAVDLLNGDRLTIQEGNSSVALDLEPLMATAVRFIPRMPEALEGSIAEQVEVLDELAEKFRRYGFIAQERRDAVAQLGDPASPLGVATAWYEEVRNGLEPLYVPEFDRAFSLYRIFVSAWREERAGRPFEPRIPSSVTPGETLVIEAGPNYGDAALLAELRIGDALQTLPLEQGRAVIDLGAELSLDTDIRLTLHSQDEQQGWPWFETKLPVMPAAFLVSLPEEVVFAREKMLRFRLRNNLDREQSGTLHVLGPAPLVPPESLALTLAANGELAIELPLSVVDQRETGDVRGDLILEWRPERGEVLRQSIPLTLLPRDASLLRSPDVAVKVDSTYYGYIVDPLTDGVTDTRDLDWQQAAWASDEGMVPHWIEFEFPDPVELSQVAVHWALDAGVHHTSRELHVELFSAGADNWSRVATLAEAGPTEVSRAEFSPARVTKLRLLQPAGQGSEGRPGLLWLSEVEAR